MSGRFRRRYGYSRRSRYSRSGFRNRWSSSARRARGNQRAANQQNDISNVTVNIMKKVKTGVIGATINDKSCEIGTAVINVFELLYKSDFYQSYSNMYDQFRINRIQVKATPVTWKTYNQFNLPTSNSEAGVNSGEPKYPAGTNSPSINTTAVGENSPTFIVPQALTIVTAWDRTGLDPSQLVEVGNNCYSTIGDNIASYSSAKSSQLVAGANFNCVRYLYPTSQQEKALYFSTSDLVPQISNPAVDQKWYAMLKTADFDSTKITNLKTDPNCPFKPTFMIGVLKVDDISYPTLQNADTCKNQISPVTFNLEFDIGVTFRGLRKTQIVYNEEELDELLEDLYYPELTDEPNYQNQEPIEFEDDDGDISLKYIKPIVYNTLPNQPIIIEPSSDEYIGIDRVHLEINVPQNANVVEFKNNPQNITEVEPIKINGSYSINDWKNSPLNTLPENIKNSYVGYNPIIVDVPNMLYNKAYKIEDGDVEASEEFVENGEYNINECRDIIPLSDVNRNKYIGFNPIKINIPNTTIPVEEPDNPNDTPINTIVTRRENGKYRISDWKSEHQNDISENEMNKIVGFNEFMVNVPNKLVYMNSEVNGVPNTGTINVNGTYTINNWKINNPGIENKDDYIGFDNIKVNVIPRLLENQVINIPSNNYPLNINTIWNDNHPNDIKDGFGNNNIIHYNEESGGSDDNKELVNAVISSSNTLQQSILTGVKDIVVGSSVMTKETVSEAIGRSVDGMLQVTGYYFKNYINPANGQQSLTITNNYNTNSNNQIEYQPTLNMDKWRQHYLTAQEWENLARQFGGVNNIQMLCNEMHIKAITSDQQGQLIPVFSSNDNNNRLEPPQPETNQEEQRSEPRVKRLRGPTPLFLINNYINDFNYNTNDVNIKYNEDYYCTWDVNCQMKTEMLEYDTINITANDNNEIEYDIVNDFINNDEKNPILDEVLDTRQYYPLGIRKLYINWPKNVVTNPVNITSENGLTISDYNSVNNTNYMGFTSVVPVNDTTYSTSSTAFELTQTTAKNIPIGSNYSGLSNVYVKPKNYTSYNSSSRYSITSNGNGSISIPSNYSGLGTVYYNVNVTKLDFKATKTSIIFKVVNSNTGTDIGAVNINSFVKHTSAGSFTAANPMYCFIHFDSSNSNKLVSVEMHEYYTVNGNVTITIPANCYSYYFTGAGLNNQLRFYFGGKMINTCELNPTTGQQYGSIATSITGLSNIGLIDYLIDS